MRKLWQTNWFDIEFNSFTILNPNNLASEEFYNQLYKEFYKKFNSYDELPDSWKNGKRILIDFILEQIEDKDKVLSIGCGNGYIENEISKKRGGQLVAIEPSQHASKLICENQNIKLINGYFPSSLVSNEKFDFAYMSYVDYLFNDNQYICILKDIKRYPIDDFLIIGASVYSHDIKLNLKYFTKLVLCKLGLLNQQLWGYQRTIEEHLKIFQKAGYKNCEYGQLENSIYWIRAKNA